MNLEGMGAAVLGGGSDADVVAAMHTLSRCVFAMHALLQCSNFPAQIQAALSLNLGPQVTAAYAFCRGRCARAL